MKSALGGKKILLSVLSIAVVAGVAIGASRAFFSDTETSVGNTITAGVIDIVVDDQNPWNTTYPMLLDKPCETNYVNFTIRNVGENSANVWKRIMNVQTDGGAKTYECVYNDNHIMVSSEPECEEGTGNYTHSYVEQDNLAAYMIYDMYICHGVVNTTDCPVVDLDNPATSAPDLVASGNKWEVVISEDNQVRIDNVNGVWIKLDDALAEGGALAVSQSYHLMAWDDAGVETITNWAQGDVMTFDIELEARQTSAPAPVGVNDGTLVLENKNSVTWDPILGDYISGALTYNTSGTNFGYTLSATGLKDTTDYCLIYYYDPYPGAGGFDIGCNIKTDSSGDITTYVGTADIVSIPVVGDGNYPAGAKLWLVPESDYDPAANQMTAWSHADYLFEMNLITYEKTL